MQIWLQMFVLTAQGFPIETMESLCVAHTCNDANINLTAHIPSIKN